MSVAATKASTASPPLPPGLAKTHPFPRTPWQISPAVFVRLKTESVSTAKFQSCVLEQTDPEAAFVLAHFLAQKPPNIGIRSIHCVHNSVQTQVFEGAFLSMEQEAESMLPAGQNEEPKAARAQVLRRWREATSEFPLVEMDKRGILTQANVLPLWHGTRHAEAICSSGFTFFGKHHFFDKQNAKAGANVSTDIGYFGSGIYFTNSAHYASMYNSDTLLLNWVTMREPYPVVNDVPIPKKGKDMIKLQGKHAYQNYNAHYIPVTSVDPTNPDNMVYHPCFETDMPAWDEYVVFNKFQALPRFKIVLEVDFPKAPSYKPPEQANHKKPEEHNHKSPEPAKQTAAAATAAASHNQMELLQMQLKMFEQQLAEKAKKATEATSGPANSAAAIPPTASAAPAGVMGAAAATSTKAVATEQTDKKREAASGAVVTTTAAAAATATTGPLYAKPFHPHELHYAVALEDESQGIIALKKLLEDKRYLAVIDSVQECYPSFYDFRGLYIQEKRVCSPLGLAFELGKIKIATLLIESGAGVSLALHMAARLGSVELIQLLLQKGKLVEEKEGSFMTPLLWAVTNCHPQAVQLLLSAGADVTATDGYGNNVFHMAASSGLDQSSAHQRKVKKAELWGDQAAEKYEINAVQEEADRITATIKLLLPYKAKLIEAKNKDGRTPLIAAVCNGKPSMAAAVTALINAGADVTAKDQDGYKAHERCSDEKVKQQLKDADKSCVVM